MGSPVVHFEIIGKDGAALRKFYKGLFGWKINAKNPMKYGIVDTASDGQGIGGGIFESSKAAARGVYFYVLVPDLDKTLARVKKAGGKV
ncbi:MAG: glyoxalase, partial [Alphaproteobacteria bacterium]|nr:glyoxalase [Alphaproteobacteria bacterium]